MSPHKDRNHVCRKTRGLYCYSTFLCPNASKNSRDGDQRDSIRLCSVLAHFLPIPIYLSCLINRLETLSSAINKTESLQTMISFKNNETGLKGLHLLHITAPLICSWIWRRDPDVSTLCCLQLGRGSSLKSRFVIGDAAPRLVRMEREVRVSDPGSIRRASLRGYKWSVRG